MALGGITGGAIAGSARFLVGADDRDLRSTLKRDEQEIKDWGNRSNTALGGLAGGFTKTTAAVAGMGVAVGVAGAFLKGSVQAAADAEASQAKVQTMLRNVGVSWRDHGAFIDAAIQKHAALTGFDDEELAESFANMVRVTGDVNEALKLNAIAADLARSKGVDLAGAQSLIARVSLGSFTGVKRLGIAVDEAATSTEVLASLQRQFAGQAEAYGKTFAGAGDRAAVAWENAREQLGEQLLPLLTRFTIWLADEAIPAVVDFVEDFARGCRMIADAFRNLWEQIQDDWRGMRRFFVQVALDFVEPFSHLPDRMGGWAREAKVAIETELAAIDAEAAADRLSDDKAKAAAKKAGEEVGVTYATAVYTSAFEWFNLQTGAPVPAPGQGGQYQPGGGGGQYGYPGSGVGGAGTAASSFPLGTRVAVPVQTHATSGLEKEYPKSVDLMVPAGTEVLAVEDGTITNVSGGSGPRGKGFGGYNIYLSGVSGRRYFYTHVEEPRVSRGDTVKAGQVIAVVGPLPGVKYSFPSHLHIGLSEGEPAQVFAGSETPTGAGAESNRQSQQAAKPTGKGSGTVDRLTREAEIVAIIIQAAGEAGVDPQLMVAIALQESGLNPKAKGDGGDSIGLFQLNRKTGAGRGYSVSQLEDPATNARIAAKGIAAAIASGKYASQAAAAVQGFERPKVDYTSKVAPGSDLYNRAGRLITVAENVTGTERRKPDEPAEPPMIPVSLRTREARASFTRSLMDDVKIQKIIIAYLQERARLEDDEAKKLELLIEIGTRREALARLRAQQVERIVAHDKKLAQYEEDVADMLERGPGRRVSKPRPFEPGAYEAADRTRIDEYIENEASRYKDEEEQARRRAEVAAHRGEIEAAGQAALAKVYESFKPQLDQLRNYWQQLFNKRKAGIERRNALQKTLAKLRAVKPAAARDTVLIAATRERIRRLQVQIDQLTDAMNDIVAEFGELESTMSSEAQQAAGEAEAAAAAAVPHTETDKGEGGGAAGGGGGGGDTNDPQPAALTAEAIAAMRAEFLSARSGFFREFSSNVFSRGEGGLLELGTGGTLFGQQQAGGGVVVVQNFQTPPADLHAYFQSAQFAAEHALG